MNKKVLLTVLQYIIFLGLGVAIILYMSGKLSDEQKADMMGAIKSVRLWLLAPIFLIGFLSHYFRALRWKLLLEQVDVKASTTNTTLAVLIGYITNLVLPRAGEVAKCTILARYEKVPADKMIGTIVAERAFDMVCLILITIAAFVFQASYIGDYAQDLFGPMSSKVKGVAATIYFQVFLVVGFVFLIAFFLFLKRIKQTKVGQFIKGLGDGIKSIFKLKKRGMFLLYTVLIWGCYWFLLMLGFWSMSQLEHLSGLCALVVLVFGSIGMIATQGGIGAYPALVGQILLFYGIEEAHGLAFGWVSWTVQTGVVVILGAASLILLPIYNRKPKHG